MAFSQGNQPFLAPWPQFVRRAIGGLVFELLPLARVALSQVPVGSAAVFDQATIAFNPCVFA